MVAQSRTNPRDHLDELADRLPGNTADAVARLLGVVVKSRGKAAFAARALDAVADLAERTDEAALIDAAGAPTNMAALFQALDRPEALVELRDRDPLGPARLRGLRAQEWLLREQGGTLSAAQIGQALGISRQAVDKRRKQGQLIGLDLGRRGFAYPAWQIGEQGALAGLSVILTELRDDSPWGQAAFFLTGNVWLDGETPLAALRRGETQRVLDAARVLGDQVAV